MNEPVASLAWVVIGALLSLACAPSAVPAGPAGADEAGDLVSTSVRSHLETDDAGAPLAGDCAGLLACPQPGNIPCCSVTDGAARSERLESKEQVVFQSSRHELDYRIPALLVLPSGKEIAFSEKRLPGACDEDSGHIQIVAKWRSSPQQSWKSRKEHIVCDARQRRDGALVGDTCGNPTPVYDKSTDTVLLVLNQNPGETSLRSPRDTEGNCLLASCTDDFGRTCRRIRKGDRSVWWKRSAPQERWGEDSNPFSRKLGATREKNISRFVQRSEVWDSVGPGNGIALGDGSFVFPARQRNLHYVYDTKKNEWTWKADYLQPVTDEGAVVLLNDGRLLRNDRPSSSSLLGSADENGIVYRRWMAREKPDGSWARYTTKGQPRMPAHDSNECALRAARCADTSGVIRAVQGSIRRFSDGQDIARLVYSGPAATRDRWGLTVRISYDEGLTWPLGRELVPPNKKNHTGYSSVAPLAGGVAVLFERKRHGKHSIAYRWVSLAGLLCGRHEPVTIGGNSWMGTYDRALLYTDRPAKYWATAVSNDETLSVAVLAEERYLVDAQEAHVAVRVLGEDASVPGRIRRAQPGILELDDGRVVALRPWRPGRAECAAGY